MRWSGPSCSKDEKRCQIHSIDSAIGFPNTYPLDRDLSVGQRHPTFEQPEPAAGLIMQNRPAGSHLTGRFSIFPCSEKNVSVHIIVVLRIAEISRFPFAPLVWCAKYTI